MSIPETLEFEARVRRSVRASIDVKERLLADDGIVSTIARIAETVVDAVRRGDKILLFGNGGSAADAQHIAAEFVGRFAFDRAPMPALALSVNSSSITAIGNDYGYDFVFARQMEALGRRGDVAIGISTSGNSANVVRAMMAARKAGLSTVAFTGSNGGRLRDVVDYCVCAPSDETPRIQECHILAGHIVAELVEAAVFEHGRRADAFDAAACAGGVSVEPASPVADVTPEHPPLRRRIRRISSSAR